MHLLDSCASCMSPNQALLTLHMDYIGGPHANYRKWNFAAQLDLNDAVGHLKTQVFSASAPSGAVAATILRNSWLAPLNVGIKQ
jgi:hypothetical protein